MPNDQAQTQMILTDVSAIQEKLDGAKTVLKSYKIKSERLSQLMSARRDITEQIEEEKNKIEDEYLEDKDYEQAKNDELTYKNQLKEKAAELRSLLHKKYSAPELQSEEHNIKGEQMKLQMEFPPKVYINGKEFK